MAKLHARPSNQYRYEHYDPRTEGFGILWLTALLITMFRPAAVR